MTLLRQIQEDATSGKVPIGTVLRRCMVLAARLDSARLEEWIRHESDGYPDGTQVPPYRVWPLHVQGNFSGPFGSGVKNGEIPISCIPERLRKRCTTYSASESISAIEELLTQEHPILVPIPPDVVRFFSDRVYQHMNCFSAWGMVPRPMLVQTVECVRNKVLDFVLEIEKLDPEAGERASGESSLSTGQVTNVFNTTIYGGAVGAVGNVKATNVNATNVNKGDISSLRSALGSSGIDEADLHEVEDALADEPRIASDGSFGPKVQSWIGKMIGKAASGAWKIGVDAAGSLLAGALRAYYGLP